MSAQEIILDAENSDWAIFENIKERRGSGTHIPKEAAADALAVSVNTGTLGTGGGALSINSGPAVVDGSEFSISQQSVDIALGEKQPRRDVVYISDTGEVEVRRGTPAAPQWGPGVGDSQRTIGNAFLPAPRSLAHVSGLALAIVYVPGNGANSLSGDASTLQDVRVSERETYDLSESFKSGEFGYRRLSSFSSVQAAIDWSDANIATVYVDGKYETSETGITVPSRSILIGDYSSSVIEFSGGAAAPVFEYGIDSACHFQWEGIKFQNTSPPRRFLVPHSNLNFSGTFAQLKDIHIKGFGGDSWTVHLKNAYGSTFSNVNVHNKFTTSNGGVRIENCNACHFDSLKVPWDVTADGETPTVYITDTDGTWFTALYIENHTTDAAVQVANSTIGISSPYIEPHQGSQNCAFQIGDGGNTSGGTGGRTGESTYTTITGGTIHTPPSTVNDTIRVLAPGNTTVTNLSGFEAINYGASSHESVTANPGAIHVRGRKPGTIKNGGAGADITIEQGKVFTSEANADAELMPFEWGWIDDASGLAIVRKDHTGALSVWRPGSGGGGGGPTSDLQWTALDSATATGGMTATLSTGGDFDRLRVVGTYGATGPIPDVTIRTEGTNTSYSSTVLTEGTLSQQTGQTAWALIPGINQGRQYSFEATVTGASSAPGANTPSIAANVAGPSGLLQGEYFENETPVSELTLEAPKGELVAELYGRNL